MKNQILILDIQHLLDMATDAKFNTFLKKNWKYNYYYCSKVSSIKHSNRIIVMHKGEIESFGDHETLLKFHQSIKKFMNLQKEWLENEK